MILITLQNDFSRSTLLGMARKCNLKGVSRLKKVEIFDLLKLHFASQWCARFYLKNKSKDRVFVNTTDPITLEELKSPYFDVETMPGKHSRYNMISFYNYMIKTGNFKDPYTDQEFTNEQLKSMDNQLKACGFMKQPLFTIKNNPHKQLYYQRQLDRQNCLLGMDRQIGELLTEMCDDIFHKLDSGANVEHSCYHTLIHMFLPNLVYLLEQLKNVDLQYTRNCLKDYISWVNKQNVPLGNVITTLLNNELQYIS